ncbi:hypothetical protein XELAEV_18040319mg [Xenopus laevis]|uniref:Pentraxin family member n=2 Tax=Xenopus laevis TaxID=8355 RepID=A0A974C9E5_XENLA|nr:hypothetical protein XELAEV_18040319mg [Xenopus laevis]
MRVLWLFLIVGSMAQKDMDRNIFFFPKRSVNDYVLLTPTMTGSLNKFTVCLRSYAQHGHSALFIVGNPESKIHNMFVVYQSSLTYSQPYFDSSIYINNSQVCITAKADVLQSIHRCVTWDSDTGVLQHWVNGKVSPLAVLQRGFSIDLQDGISLGQMRRNGATGWNFTASFQGEISDVHMWNSVLSPETIGKVLLNNINGNVISWRSLSYTIKGDVIVQPKLY